MKLEVELERLCELNPYNQTATAILPFLVRIYGNQKPLAEEIHRSTLVDLLRKCMPLFSECVRLFPADPDIWEREYAQKTLSGLQYLIDEIGDDVKELGKLMKSKQIKWLKKHIEIKKEESRYTRKHYKWVPDHEWWTFRADSESEDSYIYDEDDGEEHDGENNAGLETSNSQNTGDT